MRDEVAVLGGALDADEGAEALAEALQPLVDVVVGDLDVVDRHRDAVELGQLELRPDVDLGGELQVAALAGSGTSVTSTSGWPSGRTSVSSTACA